MRSCHGLPNRLLKFGVFALLSAAWLGAQTCSLQAAGLNQNRKIFSSLIYGGFITAECPGDLHYCPFWVWPEHSVPFGNWGGNVEFWPEAKRPSISGVVPVQLGMRQLWQLWDPLYG